MPKRSRDHPADPAQSAQNLVQPQSSTVLFETANALIPTHPSRLEPGEVEEEQPGASQQVRLELVLDLDHTLVHASEFQQASALPLAKGVHHFLLRCTLWDHHPHPWTWQDPDSASTHSPPPPARRAVAHAPAATS